MQLQKPDWRQDDQNPDELQKTLAQLLEQIAKRDQKIAKQEALLLYTQTQLTEKDSQLSEIRNSLFWKLTRPIRWTRNFLMAPGSARGSMLRQAWEMFLSSLRITRRN